MLARSLASMSCVAMLAACTRFSDKALVGIWACENEDGIEEISLSPDHSFRTLETFKKEFVTPSPIEETGSWRVAGDQLLFDSTVTWSKERKQVKRDLVRLTNDALLTKNFDGSKILTYKRLKLPVCVDSSVPDKHILREDDLIGSWRVHYNTHDYQYRFMRDNRFALFGFISGKWDLLVEGEWRIEDNHLMTQPQTTPYGPSNDPKQTWTITVAGPDCLATDLGSTRSYTLQRLK